MPTKYTEKELAALKAKESNPQAEVICPRCGKALTFREVGSSYEVKCTTVNCLKLTVRGL